MDRQQVTTEMNRADFFKPAPLRSGRELDQRATMNGMVDTAPVRSIIVNT